jgi:hypothetical protein
VNRDEIEALFLARGFDIVNISALSLDEQIEAFSGAKCVVGVHGAGLANAVFSKPGLQMLEILPPLVATAAYWVLCHGMQHHYYAIVADDPEMPRPDYSAWGHHPEFNGRNIVIDPRRLSHILDEMEEAALSGEPTTALKKNSVITESLKEHQDNPLVQLV